ncbi:MAG: YHS domain-containing protein [Acidobacteria bacterium]|nr:YHS domain-containing protein [Acidobacteriota bacterium]
MTVLAAIVGGLSEGFFMFWQTLWALVLGFALSGAVQAFISRKQMRAALGNHRPGTLAKASLFGVISSSCSYAASALAKSLFARGADFTSSMVFMIASTNLVVELGIVLWLLIGWQFALAEFVGGAIMITMLGIILPRALPARVTDEARARLEQPTRDDDGTGELPDGSSSETFRARVTSRRGWADAAGYAISDLTMLRKELIIGFLVAGFLATLVPNAVWQSVFLSGHGFLSSLENVAIAPLIAIISFVCSVGNVPLAAALWHGGISFGGVVAFVFADLVTLPLLWIYKKYYGTAITLRILAIFWITMSVAGLAVEYLFQLIRIPNPPRPTQIVPTGFAWDSTTFLNIAALIGFAVLYWLYRTGKGASTRYATDPVCGMQVETASAPATRRTASGTMYFCSDRCAERFDARPSRFAATAKDDDMQPHDHAQHEPHSSPTAIDPVCGMSVDIATAQHSVPTADGTRYFCAPGCRTAFLANPAAYQSVGRHT